MFRASLHFTAEYESLYTHRTYILHRSPAMNIVPDEALVALLTLLLGLLGVLAVFGLTRKNQEAKVEEETEDTGDEQCWAWAALEAVRDDDAERLAGILARDCVEAGGAGRRADAQVSAKHHDGSFGLRLRGVLMANVFWKAAHHKGRPCVVGDTLLHCAVRCGARRAANILVAHGPDFGLANATGETAFDVAVALRAQEVLPDMVSLFPPHVVDSGGGGGGGTRGRAGTGNGSGETTGAGGTASAGRGVDSMSGTDWGVCGGEESGEAGEAGEAGEGAGIGDGGSDNMEGGKRGAMRQAVGDPDDDDDDDDACGIAGTGTVEERVLSSVRSAVTLLTQEGLGRTEQIGALSQLVALLRTCDGDAQLRSKVRVWESLARSGVYTEWRWCKIDVYKMGRVEAVVGWDGVGWRVRQPSDGCVPVNAVRVVCVCTQESQREGERDG